MGARDKFRFNIKSPLFSIFNTTRVAKPAFAGIKYSKSIVAFRATISGTTKMNGFT